MLRAAALLAGCTFVSAQSVVPLPLSVELDPGGGRLTLDEAFTFTSASPGSSPTLLAALARFRGFLRAADDGGHAHTSAKVYTTSVTLGGCDVQVHSQSLELSPATDESYQLKIAASACSVTAPTVFGAMHGMETFVQLVRRGPTAYIHIKLPLFHHVFT